MNGAQISHRSNGLYFSIVVGEQSLVGRSGIVRYRGRKRRENVGMSSESEVRIFTIGSPRIPEEGSSAQGKSGPKPRPKGVGDGQSVEIPILITNV
jgi:hypothetical protein